MSDEMTKLHSVTALQIPNGGAESAEPQLQDINDIAANVDNSVWVYDM